MSVGWRGLPAEQAGTAGISLELPQLETALNRYDAFGRLVESEITKDGARTLAQYTYNASGYRTSKTVNGVTTEHVLDGANVAADVVGGQVTQYVRGLGLTALVQADGTRLQYVTDGHGDVKKLISGSGAVVVDYTYDAFGNQTSETEDSNPFRYSGEYYDEETGLIYLRARYYDAGIGSFTQEDPARDGENWYVYCGGNPVMFVDPTGLALRVEGRGEYIKTQLQKLTNDELYLDPDTGEITIISQVDIENAEFKNGTMLLRRIIIETDNTILIRENSAGENSFGDGIINIDLSERVVVPTYGPKGRSYKTNSLSYISLGHELIHAEHYLKGTYDKSASTENWFYDHNGNFVMDTPEYEEVRTVGPVEWEKRNGRHYRNLYTDDITENDLRWEHGLVLRSGWRNNY